MSGITRPLTSVLAVIGSILKAQIDAPVLGQVVRRARNLPILKVGRWADDCHAQVGPDPDRDHVLGDGLAQPDAGVEPISHDVGQTRIDAQLDMEVGIIRKQPLERGPEDRSGCMLGGSDADRPRWLLTQFAERCEVGAMLSSAGRKVPSSRSPASVGATLLVVRVSSRTPSLASSLRIVWLSEDWEVPSFAAARVKLCSSATVRKALRSTSSSRRIRELQIWLHAL
jgi:hypothetical protein